MKAFIFLSIFLSICFSEASTEFVHYHSKELLTSEFPEFSEEILELVGSCEKNRAGKLLSTISKRTCLEDNPSLKLSFWLYKNEAINTTIFVDPSYRTRVALRGIELGNSKFRYDEGKHIEDYSSGSSIDTNYLKYFNGGHKPIPQEVAIRSIGMELSLILNGDILKDATIAVDVKLNNKTLIKDLPMTVVRRQ